MRPKFKSVISQVTEESSGNFYGILLGNFGSSQQIEEEPKHWKQAQFFILTFNKGWKLDCGNHKSEILVSHLSKILY